MISSAAPLQAALNTVDEEIATVREWSPRARLTEADRLVDLITFGGGMLAWSEQRRRTQIRRAGKPMRDGHGVEPHPDEVVGAVARGLAILALRPYGVVFAGLHFCAGQHRSGCPRGELELTGYEPDDDSVAARGADFTPRKMADEVVRHTLDAVVYDPGPLHTADRSEWRLLPVADLLRKTVCDISCGHGAFLTSAARYLTARVMDTGVALDREQFVRFEVLSRCVYGVDIHPPSVAISRMVLALMVPDMDIDTVIWRHIRCGDSLLGITSLDQLRWMHMDPTKGERIHGKPVVDVEALLGRPA